jgi:hypothetical protein
MARDLFRRRNSRAMRRAVSTASDLMPESDTERARAAAHELIQLLSAYEDELSALAEEMPGVAPLRAAVGAALAEACYWITDQGLADDSYRTTTH